MNATAEAPADRQIVGKKQLCEILGWSRMRLDRRLDEDASFPIEARGTQAGGWQFDVAAVQAHVAADEDAPAVVEDDLDDVAPAAREAMTARQRRDMAEAHLKEDKLRKMRGELVEASDLRMALSEAVARTSTSLNKLAETLVRRLNLPETAIPIIRQEIDEARRQLVAGLRTLKHDG